MTKTRIIDISWSITNETTTWKNKQICQVKQFKSGDCRSSELHIHTHTGTHMDHESHFIEDPKGEDIAELSLERFMGPCLILNLEKRLGDRELIRKEDLLDFEQVIQKSKIVLLRTKNSRLGEFDKFDFAFTAIGKTAAQFLVDNGVDLVAFDYLGVERSDLQPGHETHKILLGNGVIIIEGVRLGHVDIDSKSDFSYGEYEFIGLPLKIPGNDGAPMRCILRKYQTNKSSL